MTVRIDLLPEDPGIAPHRHSGPVFGYMLEGEMIFELEGEPERVIRPGEAFWEPGGDLSGGACYVVSFVSVVESRHSRWFGWDYEEA